MEQARLPFCPRWVLLLERAGHNTYIHASTQTLVDTLEGYTARGEGAARAGWSGGKDAAELSTAPFPPAGDKL